MRALNSAGTVHCPTSSIEKVVAGLGLLFAGLIAFSTDFAREPSETPFSAFLRLALTIVGFSVGYNCLKGRAWALGASVAFFGAQALVVRSQAFTWKSPLGLGYEIGWHLGPADVAVAVVFVLPLIVALVARARRRQESLFGVDQTPEPPGPEPGVVFQASSETAIESGACPRPAGLARRTFAFLGDMGLLAGALWAAGRLFAPLWLAIGPYGKLVGFACALLYFGWMNSRRGGGQTFCMRLLGIAVRDAMNRPPGIMRSSVRAALLQFPIFSILSTFVPAPFGDWIGGVVFWGFGSAIIYTLLCNRGARQGFHDVMFRTYVVQLKGTPVERFPSTAALHVRVSLGLVIAAVLLQFTALFVALPGAVSSRLKRAVQAGHHAEVKREFWRLGFSDSRMFDLNEGTTVRKLEIEAWQKSPLESGDSREFLGKLESLIGMPGDPLSEYDEVLLHRKYGYDLGLASMFDSRSVKWMRRA